MLVKSCFRKLAIVVSLFALGCDNPVAEPEGSPGQICGSASDCLSKVCGFTNPLNGDCAAVGVVGGPKEAAEPCLVPADCESGICGYIDGEPGRCTSNKGEVGLGKRGENCTRLALCESGVCSYVEDDRGFCSPAEI